MVPPTIQKNFDLARQHHQAGRLAQAEPIYRQILAQQPEHADALHLLGVIAYQVGKYDAAVNLIRQAVALKPGMLEAYSNLGIALKEKGELDEAIAVFHHAISLKANVPEVYNNLANALKEKENLEEAIAAYRQAIALNPDYADAYSNLGVALKERGETEQAIAAYRRAILLKPRLPDAHFNLGNVLRDTRKLDEAVLAFRQALALKPNYPEAYNNLSNVLKDQGLFDEAIAACRQAIALKPRYAQAHSNLGNALNEKGRLDEAVDAFRQAIALKPDLPEFHVNLGFALRYQGKLDEAIASCRHAIALKPELADAHRNLAHALLSQGDLLQGWKEYEWRWQSENFPSPRWSMAQPQWDGSDLTGRTIFIHAEQGFGDMIQFIRYIPLIAERGGKVLMKCPQELRRLLEGVAGVVRWLDPEEPLPPFDVHCPLLSLPLAFGTTLENIPRQIPYLKADVEMSERWRKELAGDSHRLKVGLVWAGNSGHQNDRNRSMSLAALSPLAQVRDVSFYSLQKGEAGKQVNHPPRDMTLIDRTSDLKDFADTAALIANLDLVISVDTAVVHLAGAMGKPVWTLLPFVPDWRWLMQGEKSLWYPTMRLFRQSSNRDWESVISQVVQMLADLNGCR